MDVIKWKSSVKKEDNDYFCAMRVIRYSGDKAFLINIIGKSSLSVL